jgi:hypothetical protein
MSFTVTKLRQEAYMIAFEADKLPPSVKRVRLREKFIRLMHLATMLDDCEKTINVGMVEPPMDMEDNV